MKYKEIVTFLWIILMAVLPVQAKLFVHPGILHTKARIEQIKQMIDNKEEPAYSSYKILSLHKCSQADYHLWGPFPIISRDGEYRDTKSKMEQDFSAAYQNSLMWALTGDESHAKKSLEILLKYAETLKLIPETNDAPLLVGLEGLKIIYATEMLRYTYKDMNKKAFGKISKMIEHIFLPVMDNFYKRKPYTNGNWGPIVTKAYMAAAILWDNKKMYRKAIDFYLHANDNGTITHYIDEKSGQIQESGRDQGHSMLGIGAMATVCEMAWQQGDDLYSALNNRLMKGFEYVAKYNLGYDVPFFKWKDVTGKYSDWNVISDKGRGNFIPIFEMVYNHYVGRKGLDMPFTKQVLGKIRPEGFDRDQPSFGSLLFNEYSKYTTDWHPLDSLITSWMRKGYYPGGAVAIAKGDNLLFSKCYGAFTNDSQVYVASAGKWVAAATIAAVVDRTDLGWDDTVDKWLPEFKGNDKGKIKLRQLLSHTSGVRPYLPEPKVDNYNHLDSAIHEILPLDTVFAAGIQFQYGGLGMQIAGRMVEVAYGKEFEEIFLELLAGPLGMMRSHFTPINTDGGHAPMLGGGLCTTLHDYMCFLKMISCNGDFNGKRILSESAIKEMQSDQVKNAIVHPGEYVERALNLHHHGIYGLGEWREKVDEKTGDAYQISSPGWAGAYPWINKIEGIYGFFITHVKGGSQKEDGFSSFYSSPIISETVTKILDY